MNRIMFGFPTAIREQQGNRRLPVKSEPGLHRQVAQVANCRGRIDDQDWFVLTGLRPVKLFESVMQG
jgi:hypothetical protein